MVSDEQDDTIKLPQVRTAKDKTIAETAVHVLSREWPLPLKSLHWKLRNEHGKEVSFQATHKALNKLVSQNILLKEERNYKLNIEWLEQLIRFGAQTKQAYLEKEKLETKTGELRKQWD
ncbi:MAG: hypothetical protein JW744_00445 [Candidatus Diapherotrites archaeon]|uniref:Uncharacterized protein n=1 Tax=Candidatus Iainarchaeum sp. TaxID=3101447 RepID=A0A939C6S2_9ARCH|nr:hypothetical protein [Candidatus Diapherotrites archaeon]